VLDPAASAHDVTVAQAEQRSQAGAVVPCEERRAKGILPSRLSHARIRVRVRGARRQQVEDGGCVTRGGGQ
jgi:hypothetical protein